MLSGTVLTSDSNSALLVSIDEGGQVTGTLRIAEGEHFAGYRLVGVEADRVSLEHAGNRVVVRLGMPVPTVPTLAPSQPQPETPPVILQSGVVPDLPFPGTKQVPETDPSAAPPEMRQAAESLLQKLRDDPAFKESVEKFRPIIRQRIESGGEPFQRTPSLADDHSRPQ